eukprot:comp22449_c0_seq1/m.33735 comp22449_c0_seq1/g.33735  ORF comp22449_c0_seq1/g.33735 comp22449_c0_seq1/m.33735 type:complete len:218 (-) comp22449_c0_seq1:217-870(-)
MPVLESNHPLVKHKITLLRRTSTSSKEFRELVSELGMLLAYEATQDLTLEPITVETWCGETTGVQVQGKKLTLVPILRAGLGMLEGIYKVIPNCRTSVVGMQRNESTLEAEQYYQKLAPRVKDRLAIICDPMLATGGSLSATITCLKNAGCRQVRALVLIAAPVGIVRVLRDHPDVTIIAGNVDEGLNENGYILPGLGDAGDRLFGTADKVPKNKKN